MRFSILFLALLSTSCKTFSYVGNPEPDMKTVHMSTVHWNYTQQEYIDHPDYDCQTYKNKQHEDKRTQS